MRAKPLNQYLNQFLYHIYIKNDSIITLTLAADYLQALCQCVPSSPQCIISCNPHVILGGDINIPFL